MASAQPPGIILSGRPISGTTRLYGVMGHPVSQSLSPAIHNAAFAHLGIDAAYLPLPVLPENLPTAVHGLVALGVGGFNLTVPHKTRILPLLHHLEPAGRQMGAVNTVRNDEGRLSGTNTDGEGFLRAVEADLGWTPGGKQALMLGAGGAARGIGFALLDGGLETLVIANRTETNAADLAAELSAAHPRARISVISMEQAVGQDCGLLINTTTVGMGDGQSPVELGKAQILDGVVDIIYHPATTPLLSQAGRLGLPHANGVGMLLYQGTAAFEYWTGQTAPVEVMREALLSGLALRGE